MRSKVGKVERSFLIYKVVEPVGEKKAGMCSPLHKRSFVWAVVGKIVLRKIYRKASADIAEVFVGQGFAVVLAVSHNKKLTVMLACDTVCSCFIGAGKDIEIAFIKNVLFVDSGMSGMGRPEAFVKSAHEAMVAIKNGMLKNTEHLFIELALVDTVVIVQRCLSSPADMQGGVYICERPFHYLT